MVRIRLQTRHAVDPHLGAHIQILIKLITNRALVLFFQPFVSIRLERMSTAFGWTVDELEQHVVALIQSGEIKARVDRQNKVCALPLAVSSGSNVSVLCCRS